jgi:hypothetical protein
LFKIILGVDKENKNNCSIGSFIVPNKEIEKDKKITDFKVPIDDIEKKSGIKFFEKLNLNSKKKIPSFNLFNNEKKISDLCDNENCDSFFTSNQFSNYVLSIILRKENKLENLKKIYEEKINDKNFVVQEEVKNFYENKIKSIEKMEKEKIEKENLEKGKTEKIEKK